MAADGVTCQGYAMMPRAAGKIVRLKDGSLIAAAGLQNDMPRLFAWVEAGFPDPRPPVSDETYFLWLRADGQIFCGDGMGQGCLVAEPAVIGGATEFCLGVMLDGGSAQRAVELACQYTDRARGPVQVERLSP